MPSAIPWGLILLVKKFINMQLNFRVMLELARNLSIWGWKLWIILNELTHMTSWIILAKILSFAFLLNALCTSQSILKTWNISWDARKWVTITELTFKQSPWKFLCLAFFKRIQKILSKPISKVYVLKYNSKNMKHWQFVLIWDLTTAVFVFLAFCWKQFIFKI